MDQDDINRLREILDAPLSGTIDFKKVLGSTLSDARERFRKSDFPMPRRTVHQITGTSPES